MYPSKLGATSTGIPAAQSQGAKRDTLTLRYREETIEIEKLPDLRRFDDAKQKQKVIEHLQTVTCMFLSTDTERHEFSIHGSTAIALNLRELTTPQEVRGLQTLLQTPPDFYLPMLNNEIHDIDLACTRRDVDVKAIEKLLTDSLSGNEHYCKIEASAVVDHGTVVSIPEYGTTIEQRIYLTTCRSCTIHAIKDECTFFSLDITYPPEHDQELTDKHKKPYIKASKVMDVQLGQVEQKINIATLTELFDNLLLANKNTQHRQPEENKFNHRIKLLIELEKKRPLPFQGIKLWDRLLSFSASAQFSTPLLQSVGLQTDTIPRMENSTNTIAKNPLTIHQASQTASSSTEKESQTTSLTSATKTRQKSKETQTIKLQTRNKETQYKQKHSLDAAVQSEENRINAYTQTYATVVLQQGSEQTSDHAGEVKEIEAASKVEHESKKEDIKKLLKKQDEAKKKFEHAVDEKIKQAEKNAPRGREFRHACQVIELTHVLTQFQKMANSYLPYLDSENYQQICTVIFEAEYLLGEMYDKAEAKIQRFQDNAFSTLGMQFKKEKLDPIHILAGLKICSKFELKNTLKNAIENLHTKLEAAFSKKPTKIIPILTRCKKTIEKCNTYCAWQLYEIIAYYNVRVFPPLTETTAFEKIPQTLCSHVETFLAIFQQDRSLHKDMPGILMTLQEVYLCIKTENCPPAFLTHMKLYISSKDYSETQDTIYPPITAEHIKNFTIRDPHKYTEKIIELCALAHKNQFPIYAGTWLMKHLAFIKDDSSYHQRYNQPDIFDENHQQLFCNIYRSLTCYTVEWIRGFFSQATRDITAQKQQIQRDILPLM